MPQVAEKRYPQGNECQCVNCGLFFTSPSSFDRHQVGSTGPVRCLTPKDAGLVLVARSGGATYSLPGAAAPWSPATRVDLVRSEPAEPAPEGMFWLDDEEEEDEVQLMSEEELFGG